MNGSALSLNNNWASLLEQAADACSIGGSDWADVRIDNLRIQKLSGSTMDTSLTRANSVRLGAGIRYFVRGAVGFAVTAGPIDLVAAGRQAFLGAELGSTPYPSNLILPPSAGVHASRSTQMTESQANLETILQEFLSKCTSVIGIQDARAAIVFSQGSRAVVTQSGWQGIRELGNVMCSGALRTNIRKGALRQVPFFCASPCDSLFPARLAETLDRLVGLGRLLACEKTTPYSGNFDIVLSPRVAALMVHEAFAHLAEADRFSDAKALPLGHRICPADLNISDVSAPISFCGALEFDDEGTLSTPVKLVTNGIWSGLLTDIKAASRLGLELTGNARSTSYRFPPLPRIRTTLVSSGNRSEQSLVEEVDGGFYVDWPAGGHLRSNILAVDCMAVRQIERGKLTCSVPPMRIVATPLSILAHINGIANNCEFFDDVGWCSRGAQTDLPITVAAPSLSLRSVSVHSI